MPSSRNPRAPADGLSSSPSSPAPARQPTKHRHIFLVTGPAGCGKTSVAQYLASHLQVPYVEGDTLHTVVNVERMRNGTPLTDVDRWDWLAAVRDESVRQLKTGASGVVVTCSALKRKYRDVIRVASYYDADILVHFIFLTAPLELLLQRVEQRRNHYMGANMIQSQVDILEPPSDEEKDVMSVDVSRSLDLVQHDVLARLSTMLKADARDG